MSDQRRRVQNRESQRTFRKRRGELIKELEERLLEKEAECRQLAQERRMLQEEVCRLRDGLLSLLNSEIL